MLLNNILSKFLLDIPLLVKGYSNFKIFKDKQEFLLKVGLENIQTKDLYSTNYLQPEFLSLFPLRTIIYRGKIEKFEGEIKEITINFNKTVYKKLKDIKNDDLITLINNLFYFNENTYLAKYKNVIIPSLVIGQYFYFPNTNIRRFFRKQHIDNLVYEVDCNKGHILFKNHTKNEDITAIYVYLFQCNKYFSEAFKKAYEKNIFIPLKNNLEYSNGIFEFPKIDKELKIVVRGEKFDDTFIVYEILNFDFRQIINLEKIEISYLGKKFLKSKSLKTNIVASKIPTNKSNISQLDKYSNKYEETIFESSEFLINKENQIKVEKTEPKKFNISNSQTKTIKVNEKNEGITFGNYQDNNSKFAKGSIGISKSEVFDLEKFIRENFNVSIYECKNLKDYAYIYFSLIFRDETYREFLIVKLNRANSGWYIFSSSNTIKNYKSIVKDLLLIFDGKHKYFKNFNHYSRYMYKKYSMCFHKTLKSKEKESFDRWLQRLKERILEYDKCKGVNG
ncbi:hypothetical protein [Caminibacter mediatlanticus]|uniref:TnsE C-terminal domain-containing protein n=1 Tax=Caminibacter mediatlanticus TB-2 TaxID=391592 RepID=A0AAI9AHG0_9BACT|nr:hypothetical protein [Caminibacter mediatlanticus]EDM23580.1 hypothetical protein CMTB2_04827 [Caminibacter mediatlanticus TB-2]